MNPLIPIIMIAFSIFGYIVYSKRKQTNNMHSNHHPSNIPDQRFLYTSEDNVKFNWEDDITEGKRRDREVYRQNVCPICLENLEDQNDMNEELVITPCSHVYCKACITEHLNKNSKSCPYCWTKLNTEDLTTTSLNSLFL